MRSRGTTRRRRRWHRLEGLVARYAKCSLRVCSVMLFFFSTPSCEEILLTTRDPSSRAPRDFPFYATHACHSRSALNTSQPELMSTGEHELLYRSAAC